MQTFQSFSFLSSKNPQKTDRLCTKFSSNPIKRCRGATISGLVPPFSVAPSLSLPYLRSWIMTNRMVNNSVDYYPSHSGLTSRINTLIILYITWDFMYFSRMVAQFSLKPVYPSRVGDNFQIYGTQ